MKHPVMRITGCFIDTPDPVVPGQLAAWNCATANTPALDTASAKPTPPRRSNCRSLFDANAAWLQIIMAAADLNRPG